MGLKRPDSRVVREQHLAAIINWEVELTWSEGKGPRVLLRYPPSGMPSVRDILPESPSDGQVVC